MFAGITSVLHGIDPYFGVRVGACRNRQIKAVEAFPLPSKVSSGTRTNNSWNLGDYVVAIKIDLLIYPDGTLSSGNVDAFVLGAVIQIVRVLNGGDGGHHLTGARVEHRDRCRFPRAHDYTVIGFIQSHGKILGRGHGPSREFLCGAVDDSNLLQVREVYINVWTGLF